MPNLSLLIIVFFSLLTIIIFGIIIKNIIDRISKLSYQNRLLKSLRSLDMVVLSTTNIKALCEAIVHVVHKELGYTFGVIALVDDKARVLRRIAISHDPKHDEVLKNLPIKFTEQTVPLSRIDNLLVKVVSEKERLFTPNLYDVQVGIFPPEISSKIQKALNLKGLFIYPLITKDRVLGVIYYSTQVEGGEVSQFEFTIMEEFTAEVSRVLENAMLYENLQAVSKQLEGANLKLMQLDQLKDDFVSVVSHELRTPMTAIRSYAWMALHKADVPLSEKVERYLVRTLMSAERLINLVNDMLNISRIESGRIEINPEPVDLIELTDDAVDEAYHSKRIEKKIHFSILEQRLPRVLADPEKLREIMLNIVGNAVKFVPEEGTITISFFTDGKVVETSVKDTGPGISKEDMGKLFKKFGRLDNTYTALSTSGGTGLGLYISKSLIELMHGKIWATSDGLGKGATFTFSLPVAI